MAVLLGIALLFVTAVLRTSDVAVIAHSVSTRMEAYNVLTRLKWHEVPLKQAGGILVVCRSMLFDPLQASYDDVGSLDRDAENFHVYIYRINSDLSVSLVKHLSYRAADW